MKFDVSVKNQDIILKISVDRPTEKNDRAILFFINRIMRGNQAAPFQGSAIYIGLSALLNKCSWIDPLTMIDPPRQPEQTAKQPETGQGGENSAELDQSTVPDGQSIHYVTTEDQSMKRVAHLILLPDDLDTRSPNAVQYCKDADYSTICDKKIFTDDQYANIIFSDGFGAGVIRCTTCIARAERHLK